MWSSQHMLRVRKLYKIIFRIHRALPEDLRVLGNNYARDEFKRHKSCNPNEAIIFLNEWTNYAIHLTKQIKPTQLATVKNVGENLDPKMLDLMKDEQIVQLYELKKAAANEEDEGPSNQGNR